MRRTVLGPGRFSATTAVRRPVYLPGATTTCRVNLWASTADGEAAETDAPRRAGPSTIVSPWAAAMVGADDDDGDDGWDVGSEGIGLSEDTAPTVGNDSMAIDFQPPILAELQGLRPGSFSPSAPGTMVPRKTSESAGISTMETDDEVPVAADVLRFRLPEVVEANADAPRETERMTPTSAAPAVWVRAFESKCSGGDGGGRETPMDALAPQVAEAKMAEAATFDAVAAARERATERLTEWPGRSPLRAWSELRRRWLRPGW